MFGYILKRIALFIPTLLIISLLVFGLSQINQDDVISHFCSTEEGVNYKDANAQSAACKQIAANMGLDKPAFYFALTSQAYPDTLHQIYNLDQKNTLSNLISQYGNWDYIAGYSQKLNLLNQAFYTIPDSIIINTEKKEINSAIKMLLVNHRPEIIKYQFERIQKELQINPALSSYIQEEAEATSAAYTQVVNKPTKSKLYIPSLRWYGADNQYHFWLSNFFKGDFGKSYSNKLPVSSQIWDAVKWTILINVVSIFLVFMISIPLGVFTATKKNTWWDKVSSVFLFMLYSLPTFWVGTLFIVFITTPEYGMDWFPTGGLGRLGSDAPFWSRFWDTAYHLILPIICMVYGSFAFITRQVRSGMLSEMNQDYIRTAYAKGLDKKTIIWRHSFRNSLFPLITLIATILPATISGSLIVEIIFNIPGMGRLAYDSIRNADWPIVYTLIMLTAIFTLLGNLLADILYAMADPRVSFSKKAT